MSAILLVEDNPQHQHLLKLLLQHANYDVETATSGWEAMEKMQAHRPDLVLMDFQLPGVNGYETARLIKEQPDLCDIPIVAVSAHVMPSNKEQALAAGCAGFIEKPFNPNTIVAEVAQYLPGGDGCES